MNPRVAKAASFVAFDAADYTWVDLTGVTDKDFPDAEITRHLSDLASFQIEEMPMMFEKVAMLPPQEYGGSDCAVTIERQGDTMLVSLWSNGTVSAFDARVTNHSTITNELSVSAEVEPQVMKDLTKQLGSKSAVSNRVARNAARYIAFLYATTVAKPAIVESYTCPRNPANEKRRRKKKLPLYEWKTIVIDPNEVKRVRDAAHASKPREKYREHEVRGHWAVRRKSGKRYWVRAHKRGDPSRGSVFHDYQLIGETK
jgi:hypothetical protein